MTITHTVHEYPDGEIKPVGPPAVALFFLFLLAVSLPLSIAATHIAMGGLILFGIHQFALHRKHWIRTPIDAPVLIYLSAVFASALSGVNPGRSLTAMAELWHIALYLIAVNLVAAPKLDRRLIFLMIGVGALNGLYGIVQHLTGGFDLFAFGRPERVLRVGDSVRASGVFDHYMTYSGQMLLLGALACGLLLHWAEGKMRWVLGAAVFLLLGGAVASFTRSAWLGLLAGVLVIGGFKSRATLIRTALLASAVALALLLSNPGLRDRAVSIVNVTSDGSNIERLGIWRTTLDMIRDRPLLGVGKGNYKAEMERYRDRHGVVTHSHAHNTLLQVTAENGLIGLLAYLYLWTIFFRAMIVSVRTGSASWTRGAAIGVIGALVGFHVAGLFEYNLGDSEVNVMMWFIVGLGLAARAGRFAR